MADLAGVEDLAAYLGRPLDTIDLDRATVLLRMASSVIRGYVEQQLDYLEDDEITLPGQPLNFFLGERRKRLFLPQLPVVAVTSVVVDGTPLLYAYPTFEYQWSSYGVLERVYGWWPNTPGSIVVTYTHGYPEIPSELTAVCAAMAGRVWDNPTGVKSETIDDYAVTQALPLSGVPIGMSVSEAEATILDAYRVPVLG